MAEEMAVGCARPTGGPVGENTEEETVQEKATIKKEASTMIHVGKVWEAWKTSMAFD
jgi:hypothetical protein